MNDPLTFAATAGILIPLATALISRSGWSSNAKRWLVIGLAVAFTIVGVIFAYRPDAWTEVGTMAAVTVGVAQMIYAILKPTGALDWLAEATEPARRAETDEDA